MKKTLGLLFLVAFALCSTGCDIGGGDKSSNPVAPAWNNQYFPLDASVRVSGVGDNTTYSISGESIVFGSPSNAISGTISSYFVSTEVNVNGDDYPCYGQQTAMNFTLAGAPVVSNTITYYEYDEIENRMMLVGDDQGANSSVRLVLNGSTIPAQEYVVGNSKSYEINYNNGQKEQVTKLVAGKEEIATPIGRFETWKIVGTVKTSTTDIQQTTWFSTSLGIAVKNEVISSDNSGSELVTTKLTSLINSTSILILRE